MGTKPNPPVNPDPNNPSPFPPPPPPTPATEPKKESGLRNEPLKEDRAVEKYKDSHGHPGAL